MWREECPPVAGARSRRRDATMSPDRPGGHGRRATAARTAPRISGFGGLVGAHCIDDDVDRHRAGTGFLLNDGVFSWFLDGEDVTALVRSALAAGAVGELALMAVRALGESGGGQEIVAAALGGALLGVAPFWIRHCSIPFASPGATAESRRKTNTSQARKTLWFSSD